MNQSLEQILRDVAGSRRPELIKAWLDADVTGADSPLRRELSGASLPSAAALQELAAHALEALGDDVHGPLALWLASDAVAGVAFDVLVMSLQLLSRRTRARLLADTEGLAWAARQEVLDAFDRRADRAVRAALQAQMARHAAAMPVKDAELLEVTGVLEDALYSKLETGRVRWLSPGMTVLTGHPPAAFIDDPHLWARLVLPEDAGVLADLVAGVVKRGEAAEAVYRIRETRSGRIRRVLDRATPVLRDGRVVRIDGILIDLTERLEATSREQRREQLRAVGKLARVVAHDFNNVLVSILGHADLLMARLGADNRDARSAALVAGAAERGAELAARLSQFAHGIAPTQDKAPTHLAAVARDVVARVGRDEALAHIACRLVVVPETPRVEGDAQRLGQALEAILLNALEASDDGNASGVDVEVRPASPDEAFRIGATSAATAVIRDDGPGMGDEVKARLFEPLFTTRGDRGGAGLGGAIAFGIAVDHGGALEVDSQPGHGATLRLVLPALEVGTHRAHIRQVTRPHVRPDTGGNRAVTAETRRPRILAVDDEPSVRQLLKDLLEGAGFDVTTSATGEDAMGRVMAAPDAFDLLILDVMMHPIDGTEVFAELRTHFPDLPMIFCTGHSDAQRIAVPEAMEHAEVIRKPFRAAQLIRAVRAALA